MNDVDRYIQKLGIRITKLRKEQGLKQIDLAIRLNIEDSALRRIEKGRTNPTVKTLHNIANELNMSIYELMKC